MPGNISNQKRKDDYEVNTKRSDAGLGLMPDPHQIFDLFPIHTYEHRSLDGWLLY